MSFSSPSFRLGASKERLEITGSMKECMAKAADLKMTPKPIKPKHSRNVVLLAFKENGVQEFWANFTGRPGATALTYWKCFQLFHMIVKENHPTVLRDSEKFKGVIREQGIFWQSTTPITKCGLLLLPYSQVLLVKMDFHYKNPNIPGSVEMDDDAFLLMLDNSEPEFVVEMLREILKYWSVIANFLKELLSEIPNELKPWSDEWHCKFQPFVLCIEEAKHLYKYAGMILYKLHTGFPAVHVQLDNALFMTLYEAQCSICMKALTVEWLASSTVLTFVTAQQIPEAILQQTRTLRDESSVAGARNVNLSRIESDMILFTSVQNLQDAHARSPLQANVPSHTPQELQPTLVPIPPRVQNLQPAAGDSVAVLSSRVLDLELELSQKSQTVETLVGMNTQLTAQNEYLTHENERLENELKQLKINSGRQFCQLHAAMREKDDRIKKLESS